MKKQFTIIPLESIQKVSGNSCLERLKNWKCPCCEAGHSSTFRTIGGESSCPNFHEDLSDKEEDSFITKISSTPNICVLCGSQMIGTRKEKSIFWKCIDQNKIGCDGSHTQNFQKD